MINQCIRYSNLEIVSESEVKNYFSRKVDCCFWIQRIFKKDDCHFSIQREYDRDIVTNPLPIPPQTPPSSLLSLFQRDGPNKDNIYQNKKRRVHP